MNLLLDTPIALWAISDDPRLGEASRKLILAPTATIWVSVASLWEIGIKHSLGGGQMPVSAAQALAYFQQAGFELLEVKPEHAVGVERLPLLHPDPFDRLLIAQARWEPMRLLTPDAKMLAYGDGIEAA